MDSAKIILAFYMPGEQAPKIYPAEPLPVIPDEQSESRFFVNGFAEPVERVEAFLQRGSHNAPLEFSERFSNANHRRFIKGRLSAGWPTITHTSATVKLTEYNSTQGKWNYGVTLEIRAYKTPKKENQIKPSTAPELLSLFVEGAA